MTPGIWEAMTEVERKEWIASMNAAFRVELAAAIRLLVARLEPGAEGG